MAKVYKDAKDKNVACVMIYEHSGSYYYDNVTFKEEVDFSKEGKDLFLKGVVAVKSTGDMATAATFTASTGAITFNFPAAE